MRNVLTALIMLIGIFFRFRQYLFNRSLWLDEAWLANNIVFRQLGTLLTTPLDDNQGAPLGFLFVTKCTVFLFGNTDLAIRIVPFISGILALFLAWKIGGTTLGRATGQVCFVGLFAFSPVLVYYSSELKQYSTDVFSCLLLLYIGMNLERWKYGLLVLTLAGTGLVWLSHASVFVLAAVGTVLLLEALIKKRTRSLFPLSIMIGVWLISFFVVYWLSLHSLAENKTLVNYWNVGYAPLPIHSVKDLNWYWESALGLVYLAFRQPGVVGGLAAIPQWFDGQSIALLAVTVLGMLSVLFNDSKRFFGFVILTIVLIIVASSLRLYPFRNRLVLFLVPPILIFAGGFVGWLETLVRGRVKLLAPVMALLLIAPSLISSVNFALKPWNIYDIKGALEYIRVHRSADDLIALSDWSRAAFRFYVSDYGLEDMRIAAPIPIDNNPDKFLETICRNRILGRTWIVFTQRFNERTDFLARLQSLQSRIDSWEGDGAGAYLFDYTDGNLCK